MVNQIVVVGADYHQSGDILHLHNVEYGSGTDRRGYTWSEVDRVEFCNESMADHDECPKCHKSFAKLDVVDRCPKCGMSVEAILRSSRDKCDICQEPVEEGSYRGGADGNGVVCDYHVVVEETPMIPVSVDGLREIVDFLISLNYLRREGIDHQKEAARLVETGNKLMDRLGKLFDGES